MINADTSDPFSRSKAILKEKGEVILKLKIHAGAKKTESNGTLENGVIKLNISAVPERGKANRALLKFLSKEFGVAKSQVEIISGESDRNKVVRIVH